MKKIIFYIIVSLLLVFILIISLSPFKKYAGETNRIVKHTITIDAPVDSVFNFLGNSDNVALWSVYIDHITPLNSDSIPDGKPGSRRRCFQNANEEGIKWDELITIVEKNKRRQLTIYDTKGFPMMAEPLATEQIYKSMNDNKCELTFTLFFPDEKPSLVEFIKTSLGAYKIKSVYEQNMQNIKTLIEQKK
ncbi:MAG: SRPBCC family protein [Fimbriimonadaceae bacterium]|nr:SRPBCC family protein [Chitinophagales bacterium]